MLRSFRRKNEACCCVPDSDYVQIPTVSRKQDFFVDLKRGLDIVEAR